MKGDRVARKTRSAVRRDRALLAARAARRHRRRLTRPEGEAAGRKAAHIMGHEPESLTAEGPTMKRKQAFAMAADMLRRRKGKG